MSQALVSEEILTTLANNCRILGNTNANLTLQDMASIISSAQKPTDKVTDSSKYISEVPFLYNQTPVLVVLQENGVNTYDKTLYFCTVLGRNVIPFLKAYNNTAPTSQLWHQVYQANPTDAITFDGSHFYHNANTLTILGGLLK